jgi:hypothetical protein
MQERKYEQKKESRNEICQTKCVLDYNKGMGGLANITKYLNLGLVHPVALVL